ncbi:MAG: folylpolyglutamate synthase/dihydrofolate synthase family protein [Fervidobacterium sp.]|uniref:tetrahydrofolate synthase n=1 Tax=Fervidobacterium gondwanense DSM 13020 TaxID=1121883 RepID=A0A1M7SBH8_FERGO|nr:folylpolyglutamate synthase/dihydrofolate synthase family protein [Fervidobacterium gondwanense]UXF00441.1 folylpolyglutamate synthase [Fervidobacterium riparium]SHN55897.1 dihydrofolate synthase / folylpolyglutamate synthase [Fervidobacterium gondwanense DSM 13020]
MSNSGLFIDTLKYLYFTRPYNTMKLGLFRIEGLLSRMGNPHSGIKFFHVTGSNGKGSVTTFLEYLTYHHGHSVTGFYSPHLSTILERFHYNTSNIGEDEFVEAANEVRKHAEEMDRLGEEFSPSFFEYMTAMYFYITKMKNVEYGSVEVGLGGRFDSTNVLTPEVSVICTISLEHTNVLGNTVEEIAFEKAGIVKEGKPVVLGMMPEGALNVIKQVAKEKNSKVYEFGKDFVVEPVKYSFNENVYNYYGENTIKNIPVKLNGTHQLYNVGIALKSFELAHKLDEEAVKSAFERAFIPGRFEIVNGVVLDGSHNPQAAEKFAENIELYFPNKSRAGVFGIVDDKDKENVLRAIGPKFDTLIITRPPSKRAQKFQETYEIAKKYCKDVILEPEPLIAVDKLRELKHEAKFVTGSFYLVGYVRDYLVNGRINEELNLGGA